MKNELQLRVENAISKMKKAKEAYLKLIELYGDKDAGDRLCREACSEVLGTTHSITDILLNCFIDEKNIQRDGKNTESLCMAIVAHNRTDTDNQYLTDVDFNVLCDKHSGNLDTHLGVQKGIQDMFRLFLNYNKILLSLDANANKETVELEREPEQFNFSSFQAYFDIDEEDAEDRRYILLTESLHDINKDYLASFLNLPWSVVLDFDGTTETGGVRSVIRDAGIGVNSYLYNEMVREDYEIVFANRMMHVNMCERVNRISGSPKYNPKDKNVIDKLNRKVHDSSHPYATIVIAGNVTARMNAICTDFAEVFKETEIVILSKQAQDNMNIPEKTDDEDKEYVDSIISGVHVFSSSLMTALRRIHENKESLPLDSKRLYSDESGYRMPKSVYIDSEYIEKYQDEIEFIHMGLGNDISNQKDWEFFHGDIITWTAIKNKCTLPLIGEKFDTFLKRMKEARGHNCFYVHHLPGFGGTTLGRQLIWGMHTTFPCVRLKCYLGDDWFRRLLNDLYKLFDNSLFWVLVDQDDISIGNIEDIEKEVEKGDYNVCALVVKGVTSKKAAELDRKENPNEIVLRVLDAEAKKMLESKCVALVNDQRVYEERKRHLDENLEAKEKFPLIINLYLLEDDFKLDTYVKSRINTIPDDYDKGKIQNLLIFSAIGSYYANIKLTGSYFRQYTDKKIGELNKTCFEGILLTRKEGADTLYSVNHFLIAEEILRQLLTDEHRRDWRGKLPEYIRLYIDWLCDLIGDAKEIDERIRDIISALFTDKTKGSQLETKDDYESNFTRLLEDMEDFQRLDVICYLADKISPIVAERIPRKKGRAEYRMLAHIYAQQAKVRLFSYRIDENLDDESYERKDRELNSYIRKTTDLIDSESINEYALEDILGRCSLKRAGQYKEKMSDGMQEEDFNKIIYYVDDAIWHFKWTVWYGSPDYGVPGKIDALRLGAETIVDYYKIPEKNRLEKLRENSKANQYIEEVHEAVQDIAEYDLSSISIALAQKKREGLEKILYPEEPSELLQRLDSLRKELAPEDYEGQYFVSMQIVMAYERKHYNPNRYRRSELIKKAFEGDQKAREDAPRAFDNLDRTVKMNINHPVSPATYDRWFEYAKFMEVPLSRAKSVAQEWRDSVSPKRTGRRGIHSSAIKPYYYLFVITLLQYASGVDGVTAQDVLERKEDLRGEVSKNYHSRSVIDWYGTGKGLGKLYSHEWIDIKDVAGENRISVVTGKVAFIDDNYVGYMKLTNPRKIGNWSNARLGYSYNADCDVRFIEEKSAYISKDDMGTDKEWKFKFGFSYENFAASMNSFEVLNKREGKSENQFYKSKERVADDRAAHEIMMKEAKGNMEAEATGACNIEPIPEGVLVDFYPEEFKPKVVRGTVNGVMASVNKKNLTYKQKAEIKKAIETDACIKMKMACINPQGSGYILKTI